MNICIVYLGTKGGGARLTRDLYSDLRSNGNNSQIVHKEGSEFSEFYQHDPNLRLPIKLPSSKIFTLFLTTFKVKRIYDSILRFHIADTLFVFTMPHPYNQRLMRKLGKIRNCKVLSVIHDDKAHLGEFWPTRRTMKRIISSSNYVIFMSKYVMSKFEFQSNYDFAILESLPLLKEPFPKACPEVILVPGRIKKYKKISNIVEMKRGFPDDYILKIVGAGKYPQTKHPDNVVVNNQWLTALEFDSEIAQAGVLLNLYAEATQSGPVAIAKAYGIPILSNFRGGIGEQLEDYSGAFYVESVNDITKVMLERITSRRYFSKSRERSSTMLLTAKILQISKSE